MPEAGWYVYIIETVSGALYTGISTDPARRYAEHASGRGARYFRRSPPRRIVYQESQPDRAAASVREAAIKRLGRDAKWRLVMAAGGGEHGHRDRAQVSAAQ